MIYNYKFFFLTKNLYNINFFTRIYMIIIIYVISDNSSSDAHVRQHLGIRK